MSVIIKCEDEFCTDEPDYKIQELDLKLQCSAGADNHTDLNLINDVCSRFEFNINCLDLGCAGGNMILDFNRHIKTNICLGFDGSIGVYKQKNWNFVQNREVLKNVDISKRFSILDENNDLIKFHSISCFEVIEHLTIDQLDVFFKNVDQHLSYNGFFFGSIALFPDTRDSNGFHQDHPNYNKDSEQYILHKTVLRSNLEWDEILKNYFTVSNYDFSVRLRNHDKSYYFKCLKKK